MNRQEVIAAALANARAARRGAPAVENILEILRSRPVGRSILNDFMDDAAAVERALDEFGKETPPGKADAAPRLAQEGGQRSLM